MFRKLKEQVDRINPAHAISLGVLVCFLLFVVLKNYSPNTSLTGWDNLHPEYNLQANLARVLFAPWQEYQGLGLLGGMGHGADLVRVLIISGFGVFLPVDLLRWLM